MNNYVDAIIRIKVPEWQIGEEVKIYFKDTMYISGICEPDYSCCHDDAEDNYESFANQRNMNRAIEFFEKYKGLLK